MSEASIDKIDWLLEQNLLLKKYYKAKPKLVVRGLSDSKINAILVAHRI